MGNKTGKLILRVIYLSLAAIIMFFTSIVFFNTAKGDHILNLTNQCLVDKDYDKLQELFGGLYSSNSSVKKMDEKGNIIVATSGSERDVLIYPEEASKPTLYHKFIKAYNFYIMNSSFGTASVLENGKKKNNVGIKFITDKKDTDGNAVTYLFPFVVSSEINSDVYKEKHTSFDDYWLNYTRNFVIDKTKYGFFNFQIYDETINLIKKKTEANIVAFNVVDNEGKNVYAEDFNLAFNFDEDFYAENQAGYVFKAYNDYLPYYDSYRYGSQYTIPNYIETSNEMYNNKTTAFNEAIDKFFADLKKGGVYDSSIKVSLNESEIMTGDVIARAVWRTIGIEALILLVIVVLYILLFHFRQFRDFIFRNEKRTPIRAKVVNKEPEEQTNKFKYNQASNPKKKDSIDTKPVEVKETEESVEDKKEEN